MSAPADADIYADLGRLLGELHGQDFTGLIAPECRFFGDLGLASIDAVVLGEALQRHYGRALPFADLMAELGQRAERDITLGELVAFLRRNL